jgi:head-tail adaptor
MIKGLIQTKGQTMQVLRPVLVRDSVGSRKQTFHARPSVQGYVASRSVSEGFDGNRQRAVETISVYVSGGEDILMTDRLKFDGQTYEVIGKRTPGMRSDTDRLFYHIIDAVGNEDV